MKLQHIIGVDLSKESLDFLSHERNTYLKAENGNAGFRQLLEWLGEQKINCTDVMIVMEHTGLYSYHLEAFLHKHHIAFAKVSALAIKKSLGLVRGKNDKIDAKRIARYGFEKRDVLVPQPNPEKGLQRLQLLHSGRTRLVRLRTSLKCAVTEIRSITNASDLIITSHRHLIKDLTDQIKKIEAEIKQVTSQNASISCNTKLLQSVKCVGKVLSTATMVKTQNFTRFTNPRKFSCYCGTAPFEHSSGKSIRGKTKVSHLADKEMKYLLDRSACSAIQYDKELKAFYERRLAMGKSKRSTINIVRNKIIYRMFAVIKRQTPFRENYLQNGLKRFFGS